MDYRELLKRYIEIILMEEGTTFSDSCKYYGDFTADEMQELDKLFKEASQN